MLRGTTRIPEKPALLWDVTVPPVPDYLSPGKLESEGKMTRADARLSKMGHSLSARRCRFPSLSQLLRQYNNIKKRKTQ